MQKTWWQKDEVKLVNTGRYMYVFRKPGPKARSTLDELLRLAESHELFMRYNIPIRDARMFVTDADVLYVSVYCSNVFPVRYELFARDWSLTIICSVEERPARVSPDEFERLYEMCVRRFPTRDTCCRYLQDLFLDRYLRYSGNNPLARDRIKTLIRETRKHMYWIARHKEHLYKILNETAKWTPFLSELAVLNDLRPGLIPEFVLPAFTPADDHYDERDEFGTF